MVDTEEPLDNKDPMDLDDTIIHKDPGQDRIGSGVSQKLHCKKQQAEQESIKQWYNTV